jgi:hypothetical protein
MGKGVSGARLHMAERESSPVSAGEDKKLKNLMSSLAFKLAGIPNRDGTPHPPTAYPLHFTGTVHDTTRSNLIALSEVL